MKVVEKACNSVVHFCPRKFLYDTRRVNLNDVSWWFVQQAKNREPAHRNQSRIQGKE